MIGLLLMSSCMIVKICFCASQDERLYFFYLGHVLKLFKEDTPDNVFRTDGPETNVD